MKFKRLFLLTFVSGLFSLGLQSCDDDDFPPSKAEESFEELQSYHAEKWQVYCESMGVTGYNTVIKSYEFESPYLKAVINDYTYSFDMSKVMGFQYDDYDKSVIIWFE